MRDDVSLSSLGYMLAMRKNLRAYCSNAQKCRHSAPLDFAVLIDRLGADFDIVASRSEFRRRLICTQCATRFPTFIISSGQVRPITQASGLHPMSSMSMDQTIEAHRQFTKQRKENGR